MSVASRLRISFAVYLALLAAVVAHQVRTIRNTVESGHVLTTISTRLRVTTDQLARIDQISTDAEKYLVTRDRRYREKVMSAVRAYGEELRRLEQASLGAPERAALLVLDSEWRLFESQASRMTPVPNGLLKQGNTVVARMQSALDRVRIATERLSAASQDAMSRELALSESEAARAERLSWWAAIAAVVLGLLLSAALVRSVVRPLNRLAEGTLEVSAGRFDYRLDTSGDDEFSRVASDFNSMTERLDEVDRMKRDFVAKVSHDLKSPLTSMQETIGVLLDQVAGPLSAKQRELLELNLEGGRRLSAMLNKLLDLSRIEAGLEPDFQMLDVLQVVARSVDRAKVAGAPRELRLTSTETAGRLLVRGDADGISRVMDNLIENAIKFSPPDGVVQVTVADGPTGADTGPWERAPVAPVVGGLRGAAVLLSVTDEGPGIADDEKKRVFARFYQTEAGRATRSRGVGLGLTICNEIVAAHGGAIWVEDSRPRGSVFRVLLGGAVRTPDISSRKPRPALWEAHG